MFTVGKITKDRNLIWPCIFMLSYFCWVLFKLPHCVTDTIYVPVIKNIDILISLLLFLFIYVFIFLN